MCGAVACAATAGCGDAKKAADRPAASRETADRPAPLPRGWRRIVDTRAGFTLGLPPGWTVQVGPPATRARAPGGAVALSVSADRSADGRNDSPQEYLRQAVANLKGYRGLHVGPLGPLKGYAYPAAGTTAAGVFVQTGVRQQIQLYALRRRGLVTYVIAVFRNADIPASRHAASLDRIVHSLRARPPRR